MSDASSGEGSYASVNGLALYHEIHGSGDPLVLIPGGLMTIDMMGLIVPSLATTRQVIAIEPQAHGHTTDTDRPLSYEQMADDAAALIRHLGFERADVFGFSAGGGVALQTAIRHPNVVRKLVLVSATHTSDGEYPEIRAFTSSFEADTPMLVANREAYVRAAGTPGGWAVLVAKMRQLLTEGYDWAEDVGAIRAPALVVAGDADTLPPSHAVEMFTLLGGGMASTAMGGPARSHLALLPATTHLSILSRVDLLVPIISSFLDAPMPQG